MNNIIKYNTIDINNLFKNVLQKNIIIEYIKNNHLICVHLTTNYLYNLKVSMSCMVVRSFFGLFGFLIK